MVLGGTGSYWSARITKGGEVLTPRDVSDFIQFIDVKDCYERFSSLPEKRRDKERAGIKPDKEQKVLAAWKEAHNG